MISAQWFITSVFFTPTGWFLIDNELIKLVLVSIRNLFALVCKYTLTSTPCSNSHWAS
jgi:hypothetical protein